MVAPLVFEILPGLMRGEALRNWLRTDGAAIFRSFSTGVEALDYVRELGLAIRSQDFYAIRREVLEVTSSSIKLMNYPDNQLIPLNWHVKNHGLELSSDFQYRINMIGADQNTGILKNQWMTIASDRQLTPNEVREAARSYVGEGGASGEIQDVHFGEIEPLRR